MIYNAATTKQNQKFWKVTIHYETTIAAPTEEDVLDRLYSNYELDGNHIKIECIGEE